jgi:N-acetylglutamate synthase-like GNAT family acetyltransferase
MASSGSTSIRAADSSDVEQICRIDTDASAKFASIPALADLSDGSHGPLEGSTVQDWLATGTIYVLENESGMLGFTAVQPKDSVLYVAELSVIMAVQGRGMGSLLFERVFEHARQMARDAGRPVTRVSLTTYPDVPWNGPWYKKRGFREIDPASLGPWHVEKVRQDERDLARPSYRRCCMLREEELGH